MERRRGWFIVLEGGDGSGKTTQAKLLVEALERRERRVAPFKFPRNDARFGALAYECLAGRHGDFRALSPHLAALPYMLDQALARGDLERALASGAWVVCDRYAPSNLAFQGAKVSGATRSAVVDFIERATYEDLGALRPDIVIVLDMPAAASRRLLAAAGRPRDQHERDDRYQSAVRALYRALAAGRPDWHLISCAQWGRPLPPAVIHRAVLARVARRFRSVSGP